MVYPNNGPLLSNKRNKLLINATAQMNLKIIMLGKRRRKNRVCMIPFILENANQFMVTEHRSVVVW